MVGGLNFKVGIGIRKIVATDSRPIWLKSVQKGLRL